MIKIAYFFFLTFFPFSFHSAPFSCFLGRPAIPPRSTDSPPSSLLLCFSVVETYLNLGGILID